MTSSSGPDVLLPENPTIAVVGSVGRRLLRVAAAQSGLEVHFLLRSDYDAVKAEGWRIESPVGDFEIRPKVYRVPGDMPKADLIFIGLKTTSNDQYESLLRPQLKANTVLFTLQNGLGSDDLLARLFGAERVVGGLCYVGINRAPPNIIRHLGNGLIKFGDFNGGQSSRTEQLGAMLAGAKIPREILASLKQGRWDKLLWNIPFNGLGAALDLEADRLIDTDRGMALVAHLITEIWQAGHADGCVWPVDLATMIDKQLTITRNLPGYRSSMQIDRQEGRPLELEAILGEPLRRARALGVSTPTLAWLYEIAQIVDPGRRKAGE